MNNKDNDKLSKVVALLTGDTDISKHTKIEIQRLAQFQNVLQYCAQDVATIIASTNNLSIRSESMLTQPECRNNDKLQKTTVKSIEKLQKMLNDMTKLRLNLVEINILIGARLKEVSELATPVDTSEENKKQKKEKKLLKEDEKQSHQLKNSFDEAEKLMKQSVNSFEDKDDDHEELEGDFIGQGIKIIFEPEEEDEDEDDGDSEDTDTEEKN